MEFPMRLFPALALTILFAPADAARAESSPDWDGPVLEIVTFRLVAGATDRGLQLVADGADPSPTRAARSACANGWC